MSSYLYEDACGDLKDLSGIKAIIDSFKLNQPNKFKSLANYVSESSTKVDKEGFLYNLIPTIFELKRKQADNYKRFSFYNLVKKNIKFVAETPVVLFLAFEYSIPLMIGINAILLPACLINFYTLEEKYRELLYFFSGIDKNSVLPYLGYLEKNVSEEASIPDPLYRKLVKNISLNYRLRELLCETHLVGAIGKKKSGKSTFVELITGQKANSRATEATEFITPYKICGQVSLLDYPHFNSSHISHKIQFYFTKSLLDYMFIFDKIMDSAETDDTHNLLEIVKRNGNKRFSLIFNRMDDVWQEIKAENNDQHRVKCLRDQILKKSKLDEDSKLYLTILNKSALVSFEDVDRLSKTICLDASKLRRTAFEDILEYFPSKSKKYESIRGDLLLTMNQDSLKSIQQVKEIEIENATKKAKSTTKLKLSLNSMHEAENTEYVTNMVTLLDEMGIADALSIQIKSKTNPDFVVSSFEDFFSNDFQSFTLSKI